MLTPKPRFTKGIIGTAEVQQILGLSQVGVFLAAKRGHLRVACRLEHPRVLPGERHLLIRAAEARWRWAEQVLAQLGLLARAAIAEETGLEPLDGGGQVSPPRLPELRLVGCERSVNLLGDEHVRPLR